MSSFQEKEIVEVIQITEKIFQDESEAIIINERYAFIARLIAFCATKKQKLHLLTVIRLTEVVINRWLALPIFAFVRGLSINYLFKRLVQWGQTG